MRESEMAADPIRQFSAWYAELGSEPDDAVCLVTAAEDGRPSGRMVLLRGFDERGFRIFTNRTSAKARDLRENPRAGLVFHWAGRQVRVEGRVDDVTDEENEDYWATRPRPSQLGAWASEQSTVIPHREALEARLDEVTERFEGGDVPLPPFWGGFRVVADVVEFWEHRDDRLHDRIRYTRSGNGWRIERLAP